MWLQISQNVSVMSITRVAIFRPCIDLHNGQVKQIVGGSLSDVNPHSLRTNFVSSQSADEFVDLYKRHNLEGGHIIKLGTGNDDVALGALRVWPGALQIGGGINEKNAQFWLDAGASKVIVTSYLFPGGHFCLNNLKAISAIIGKDKLVVDVRCSCRRRDDKWLVAMNRWQDITDMEVCKETLDLLSHYCSEFLVHAADVEGLCRGIDEDLVQRLGEWVTIPTTYAGGAKDISDLDLMDQLARGGVDLTFGSALDIYGGTQVSFDRLLKENAIRATTNRLYEKV